MHNLHLIVLKANSAKEACRNASNFISDFGNDNNWREICGCVSKSGRVYDTGNGRYTPNSTKLTSIAKINRNVMKWMENAFLGEIAKEKLAKTKGKVKLNTWSSSDLYSLERLARHHYEALPFRNKKFNVLEDNFFAYAYNECGVTQVDENGRYTYVVFIDMHD